MLAKRPQTASMVVSARHSVSMWNMQTSLHARGTIKTKKRYEESNEFFRKLVNVLRCDGNVADGSFG